MDGEQVAALVKGTSGTTPTVQRTRAGRFSPPSSAAEPSDLLYQLRCRYKHWAFMYDDRAGLFHAVRGRRHFVATSPAGPWHQTATVRMW